MQARPEVGKRVETELRVEICALCGHRIMATYLCSNECALDGDSHDGNIILAVWHRVDTFVRDERPGAQ